MNKLILDKKEFDIINDNPNLEINIVNKEDYVINYFNDNNEDINIKINMDSDSKLNLNVVCLFSKDTKVNIEGTIKGNNNELKITFRALGIKNHADVKVNIIALENTSNNIAIEDLKAINEEGTVTLIPVLEIDSMDIDASHFATVGFLQQDQLFYLISKGINYENAYNMLKDKFLYAFFSKKFIDKIIMERRENE